MKFHDGTSLTADDVVASTSLFQEFEGKVGKVERLTVRFTLTEPNSGFLHKLSNINYSIAPSKTVTFYKSLEKEGRLREFIPVGSGPFKFSRWGKGKEIVLESFADYWQGSPWLEKVVYKVIPDNKARISALEKGEIDVIDVIISTDLPQIQKNPNLKMISKYGMNIYFLSMNTTRKPVDNLKVRQALNLAVDKMRLIRMFYYGGYGVPTNRILSPAFWGFTALPRPGNYRPAVTKKMLAIAGYEKGFTLKLVCVPGINPYFVEEIKRQMADVGVQLNIIVPANFSELISILKAGDYDIAFIGWIDVTGDPDYTLRSLLSSNNDVSNTSRWHNRLFDKKLQDARKLPINDMASRLRLYNEAQGIAQEEVPLIPLFHQKIIVIHNRKVKGIIFYPSSMVSYHKVRF